MPCQSSCQTGFEGDRLECGWDKTSKAQETFDKEAFIEKRQRYMIEFVKPLVDKEDEIMERQEK